jgi:prepilin-type N-terminal cleavage/methylation domain-containing protein
MFNFFNKNKKSSEAGFTLIEILVVVTIFSLLMVTIAGIYVAFSRTQLRTKASQRLLNDSQYALELMAREIKNDYILNLNPASNYCQTIIKDVPTSNCILLLRDNGQVIAFATYQDASASGVLDYFVLDCNSSYASCSLSGVDASLNLLSPLLNSAEVLNLKFQITPTVDPAGGQNNEQPKITILLTTKNVGAVKDGYILRRVEYRLDEQTRHILQTTVSSRIYRR